MKNLLILSITAGLLFAGCMSDNSVNPVPQGQGGQKLQWLTNSDNTLKTETELTISRSINGSQGGKIMFNEYVGNINAYGSLSIPVGAYSGMQTISITFSDLYLYQVYTPTPFYFKTPLILNLTYKNVDLMGVDPKRVSFYYLGEDGLLYKAEYESLIVDPFNKVLSVTNAKIPHFSRWGWAKTAED